MSLCRSCGAEIEWAQTANGNLMPVNSAPTGLPRGLLAIQHDEFGQLQCRVLKGEQILSTGERLSVSHFSTCPQADEHRKTERK